MKIETFICGSFFTNCYIVFDEETNKSIVIDAPQEGMDFAIDFIKRHNLSVEYIILTHGHIDHIAHAEKLRTATGAKLLIHENEQHWLEPNNYTLTLVSRDYIKFVPDVWLKGNEKYSIGKNEFEIIHTPGHTEGGISIYFADSSVLFSGDTLFQESIGRTDLIGGSIETLLETIYKKLLVLPESTIVYPGHGERTMIKHEKHCNPFLQNGENK